MPTSAPGSKHRPQRGRARGFTLIELLVVIAIVALAAGIVALSLPDPAATRLEQDGARLAVLLESARLESRSSGQPVSWLPGSEVAGEGFHFVGLPPSIQLPGRWLDERVSAQVVGSDQVTLGPDAILRPQRILLRLDDRRLELGTDGLGPFAVLAQQAEGAP